MQVEMDQRRSVPNAGSFVPASLSGAGNPAPSSSALESLVATEATRAASRRASLVAAQQARLVATEGTSAASFRAGPSTAEQGRVVASQASNDALTLTLGALVQAGEAPTNNTRQPAIGLVQFCASFVRFVWLDCM